MPIFAKKIMIKLLLKYFYSWYTLPMVYLHEYSHAIMAFITGIEIKKIKIYKNKKDLIYNGYVSFKYKKYGWRWFLVIYAPLLLTIPIFLMFFNTFFLCFGLYILTTIIYYDNHIIWMVLPSKMDIFYIKKIEYYTYIVNSTSEEIFNIFLDKNELYKLIKEYNLLNNIEFIQENINKKEKYQYNKK